MDTLEIITSYDVAKESESSAFSDLRDSSFSFPNKDSFFSHLRLGEERYMEYFYIEDDQAKKKSGEWKYRTYLPKGYSSAKSVIGTAMDLGINTYNKGKTEIEKEIKALKNVDKTETTPEERAMAYVTKLKNVWPNLSEEGQTQVIDNLQGIL